MKKLFLGTSGYNYKHWKETFYPQGLAQKKWLEYYSTQFNSVEINATFYRDFDKHVFANWRERTKKDFAFVIKGTRRVTHMKRLHNVRDDVAYFFENAVGLEEKLSCVLWQFPSHFRNNKPEVFERFEQFLALLPKDIRQAVELRDTSWFKKPVFELLDTYNISFVINETSQFPVFEKITGDFVYIRFHGPTALYASSYSDVQLLEWAEKIKIWLKKHDVYCFFNNDINGHAVRNARILLNLLQTNEICA